tara:strand:+ start:860 stop:1240 length:381 start_codon:yes stop_codon:yes gene_type:complete
MSRVNWKGRNKHGNFVLLRHDIMDSPAYLSMSPAARCVYQAIKRRFNGHNNGDIPLSCREASDICKISKTTAANAFEEVRRKGLAEVASEAGFNQKGGRRSRRWRLTEEPCNGQPATSDWRKWKSD